MTTFPGQSTSGRPQIAIEAAQAMSHLQRLSIARQNAQRQLTPTEIEELEQNRECEWCGGYHVRRCPRVKRLEWASNGTLTAVEFWPHDAIDWTGVLFTDQGDEGPSVLLDDLDEDLHLVLYWVENGGKERTEPVIKAVRRLNLLLEAARNSALPSEDDTQQA